MKTTFLFTSMLISVGLSTESEIPPDKVNTLGLRAGAFDNRPGTCFDTNHFVHVINRWKANDKGTEKHDKTSKNRTLWTRNQSVHSLRLPLIIHHPVNQFKKIPWMWLHWRTVVRTKKNRKHQHQMWPGKENSIPSGKRNFRGWSFFWRKKMHNLQYLPSSTLGCREITVSFWLE